MSHVAGRTAPARPIASTPDDVVSPTLEDPVVRGASAAFGGPLGRHVRANWSWWTPLRVLIAMVVASMLLGYAEKYPCRNQPWNSDFQYSHACYNDVYPLYFSEGLAGGKIPYLDTHSDGTNPPTHVEYPILIGATMEVGSLLTHALYPKNDRGQGFFDITWMMMLIAAVVTVIATALTARRRVWDAALFALAPGLILAGPINWDLLAVALTALSMWAWSRSRVFTSGVFLGLAVATKFFPLILLAPLFVLCLRARQLRAFFVALGGAALAWAIVDVPVWIASPAGFLRFYTFNRSRTADWGSIWYALTQMFNTPDDAKTLNLYEGALVVMAVLGIAALILGAPRRPRLPQVFFLTLAVFLLLNKVYSPQYVLWLLPLFALARPRWRAFLVWQFAEVLYFLGIWLYLSNVDRPGKGLELDPYLAALWCREIAVLAMCVLVVIDIVRPHRDVVRMDGSDDPAGGVLDNAPDIFSTPAPAYTPTIGTASAEVLA